MVLVHVNVGVFVAVKVLVGGAGVLVLVGVLVRVNVKVLVGGTGVLVMVKEGV